MLNAIQFLGSSSSSILKNPYANFPLISWKPIEAANPKSSRSQSLAFRVTAMQSTGLPGEINFCQSCGGPTKYEIPDGDGRMRAICTTCGKRNYENPKMAVACLVEHENKILLCKRGNKPSYGRWTLPGGHMEIGESTSEGAKRETWEEANADVEVESPLTLLDLPIGGVTYITFLAKLKTPHFSPGPESLDCQLFAPNDIPFASLAFSSILITIQLYLEDKKTGKPRFHFGVINKRPGTAPSEIYDYTLEHHVSC